MRSISSTSCDNVMACAPTILPITFSSVWNEATSSSFASSNAFAAYSDGNRAQLYWHDEMILAQ
jgi:hypothetical protein